MLRYDVSKSAYIEVPCNFVKNQELSHTLMQIFLFLNDLFSEFLKFCFFFKKMRLLSFAENH